MFKLYLFCHQVRAFLQPPMDGIVLETYGSGNAPDNRADLLDEIRKATQRGLIMINCTQCLRGSVTASYATGQVRYSMVVFFCKASCWCTKVWCNPLMFPFRL